MPVEAHRTLEVEFVTLGLHILLGCQLFHVFQVLQLLAREASSGVSCASAILPFPPPGLLAVTLSALKNRRQKLPLFEV